MTPPLRVVQVGLGDWGRDWAWRINPTVEEVQVVGYVDSDPLALQLLGKQLPVAPGQLFTAFGAAVEATRPDAALITTTLAGHQPLTRTALEAGLHVLVEKTFTETLERARGR